MKLKYLLLAGFTAVAALSACVSENQDIEGTGYADKGRMSLSVNRAEPMQTRATSVVTNYPVILYDAEGRVLDSWNTVEEVPNPYVLSVGNYSVESHTPGILKKKMDTPYYKGTAAVEIIKDNTTNVEVTCKMQNSPITLNYDADFLSVFTSWSITLDDGSETALAFTKEDGNTTATTYWLFEGEVDELVLNFRGTTKEGSTVSARNTLTKNQAAQHYDGDLQHFTGGDALVINFTPVESTAGKVVSITINATVTFTETETTVGLEVTDNGNLEPTPGTGGETGGDDTSITLNLPNNMTVNAATDKSLGDTYIKCDNGIKSIKVSIESTSDEMLESLGDLNTNYGVDFIGGAEIVGNQSVVQLFNDLNQPLSVPAVNDADYTFPIGNFFGLLGFLSGEHTFNMVVEDMNGNKKNGKLVLTVE